MVGLARKLGESCKVVVYDRAGYGASSVSKLERTPANIVKELHQLLAFLNISRQLILLGHSQGGLYLTLYALKYRPDVKALVLLDPATIHDLEFKTVLTPKEYEGSGIDKTRNFKMGKLVTTLGLGPLLKPLLVQGPPFYYTSFPKEDARRILASLTKRSTYRTALSKYAFTHDEACLEELRTLFAEEALGDLPLVLVTHDSEHSIKECVEYGGLTRPAAEKVENVWQQIMRRYLPLSSQSEHRRAGNSSHFIHLTDALLVQQVILSQISAEVSSNCFCSVSARSETGCGTRQQSC